MFNANRTPAALYSRGLESAQDGNFVAAFDQLNDALRELLAEPRDPSNPTSEARFQLWRSFITGEIGNVQRQWMSIVTVGSKEYDQSSGAASINLTHAFHEAFALYNNLDDATDPGRTMRLAARTQAGRLRTKLVQLTLARHINEHKTLDANGWDALVVDLNQAQRELRDGGSDGRGLVDTRTLQMAIYSLSQPGYTPATDAPGLRDTVDWARAYDAPHADAAATMAERRYMTMNRVADADTDVGRDFASVAVHRWITGDN